MTTLALAGEFCGSFTKENPLFFKNAIVYLAEAGAPKSLVIAGLGVILVTLGVLLSGGADPDFLGVTVGLALTVSGQLIYTFGSVWHHEVNHARGIREFIRMLKKNRQGIPS